MIACPTFTTGRHAIGAARSASGTVSLLSADADLSATLAAIREAAGNEHTSCVLYGLERMVRKSSDWEGWVSEEYETVAKVIADLGRLCDASPRLLAALSEVLKLADDWDAPATYLNDDMSDPNTQARECANDLRETITTALAGKEPGDAR